MGFSENFLFPKMQFPSSLLPPKQVRCNSYDPSSVDPIVPERRHNSKFAKAFLPLQ